MKAIYKREVSSYFNSMIGWIFVAVLTVFIGIYFFAYNLFQGYPYFSLSLGSSLFIFMVVVPILTMRSMADERHTKTDQLLLTAPVSVTAVVLGKYFAMLTVFAVPVAIACLCPLIIALNGTAFLLADYGAILAFFLLGAVEIAVGMLISSLTESQIIAAVGTFGLLLLLYLWDGLVGFLPSTAVGSLLGFFVVLILVCFLINALSNNLIMVDRKLLKNPNGLILGTPGSGKSFSAKREIANCFLLTSDDVIICDPEAEYAPLVERLHGQVIKISPTSTNYINPMDLNLDYSDDESPLSLKSDFILSLCELIVGGKDGLQPVQKTIIDRCVRLVYQTYLNDPRPENMPILEDLYNLLRSQEEKEAQYIATALEIYVTGSLNVFNHQSNVDINNRIVCYDIKELGKQLKKIGMLVVQDQVWNRVTINRAAHKSTRYYIDEMHLLLKEEQTAAYTVEIWKRFRKWGGIPTGDWVCNLLAA